MKPMSVSNTVHVQSLKPLEDASQKKDSGVRAAITEFD